MPEVVERVGLQRRIGREEHVGAALEDHGVDDEHAQHHQAEREPAQAGRRQAAAQQDRAGEVEDGHLEEDDEEDQHVEPVQRQEPIEQVGGQQVHGLPPGHHDPEGRDDADQEVHDGDHGVDLEERLRVPLDLQAGDLARP